MTGSRIPTIGPLERVAALPADTSIVVGLISGSHFVNHMYLVLLPPILGLLSGDFGVTLAALGFAMGLQGAINTVMQLPYGYLSDNHSRTLTLGICLGFGAAGVLVIVLSPSFEWLLAGQALIGLGVAGHHPSHYPLLADASPESIRGRVFSVHGFAGSLGFAAPPAIITAIISFSGLTWRHALGLIGVVGAIYTVIAIVVLRWFVSAEVRLPSPETTTTDQQSIADRVRAEFASLIRSPAILALALLALVASTASWGITSYVVVLLTDGYGIELSLANLTLSGMYLAGAVMILIGGELTDRFSAGPVIVTAYSVVAVIVAVLGSMTIPGLIAVACAIGIGGMRSLAGPARSKLTDRLSARTDLGKNFATITIGIMLGNAFAPPFFGALIERAGLRVTFLTIAAIGVLAVGLTIAILRTYSEDFTIVPSAVSGR
ncbi:MAG: MFS transporter [Halobacteriales archaeon]